MQRVYEDDVTRAEEPAAAAPVADAKKVKTPEERQAEIVPMFSAAIQVRCLRKFFPLLFFYLLFWKPTHTVCVSDWAQDSRFVV